MTYDAITRLGIIAIFQLALLPCQNLFSQVKGSAAEAVHTKQEQAIYDLIMRTIPKQADQFAVRFIPDEKGRDVFEIESREGKIILSGNNGVSIASALNYYLKNVTHCQITWNGTNLNLPTPLPAVTKKIRKTTPYRYRYYLNYCTFNYTMSWWHWKRWQKEIDWMALNGINMPLAITGQNALWQRVYKKLGLTTNDLKDFFSGPAHFSWFWMGNLDAWGGPLPQSWMQSHEILEKKILDRERSLGMTPVLPAFTGHVPSAFGHKFPESKLRSSSWEGFPPVYSLDPLDPMFSKIGKMFIREEMKTFGTNHFYSADIFNENTPSSNDSAFLDNMSKKVYNSMSVADPKAKWIMQGWLFYFDKTYWRPTQIKALLNAVPDDKMIVLDLWSERNPVWNKTNAYYGKPWIWNMLQNFGGNTSLSGTMKKVADGPYRALHDSASGKMYGIGLTMEAIEQNPVLYDLMMENVWKDEPVNLDTWLTDYALRRYGKKSISAEKAWQILRQTVYQDSLTNGGPKSIITSRPTFIKNPGGTNSTKLPYDPRKLAMAWNNLVSAAKELKNSDGYQFDLVDLTRQVLANYASDIQQRIAADYKKKDMVAFRKDGDKFIGLIDDIDKLLATRKDFLLGNWLNEAKSWGTNKQENDFYEKNARDLITLWGDEDCRIHDYASKQWSGLLTGFYKKRWEQFFSYIEAETAKKNEPDMKFIENSIKQWEWQWVNSHENYTRLPEGNSVDEAISLYQKYFTIIMGKE